MIQSERASHANHPSRRFTCSEHSQKMIYLCCIAWMRPSGTLFTQNNHFSWCECLVGGRWRFIVKTTCCMDITKCLRFLREFCFAVFENKISSFHECLLATWDHLWLSFKPWSDATFFEFIPGSNYLYVNPRWSRCCCIHCARLTRQIVQTKICRSKNYLHSYRLDKSWSYNLVSFPWQNRQKAIFPQKTTGVFQCSQNVRTPPTTDHFWSESTTINYERTKWFQFGKRPNSLCALKIYNFLCVLFSSCSVFQLNFTVLIFVFSIQKDKSIKKKGIFSTLQEKKTKKNTHTLLILEKRKTNTRLIDWGACRMK